MDTIFVIMTEGKGKSEGNRENRYGQAAEIFPQRYNAKQIEDTILRLLERELQRKTKPVTADNLLFSAG